MILLVEVWASGSGEAMCPGSVIRRVEEVGGPVQVRGVLTYRPGGVCDLT